MQQHMIIGRFNSNLQCHSSHKRLKVMDANVTRWLIAGKQLTNEDLLESPLLGIANR